jgi:hypothetical protein
MNIFQMWDQIIKITLLNYSYIEYLIHREH